MASLTAKIDPKLEKYRPPKAPEPPFVPQDQKELAAVIRRTPRSIVNNKQRKLIAVAMSMDEVTVADVMQSRRKMSFVRLGEELGPLLLAKLHRTGIEFYPVLDENSQICGSLRPDIFDVHKVSENSSIEAYLDPRVVYVREDYSVSMALSALLRNNVKYGLVIDSKMRVRGFVELSQLSDLLLPDVLDTDKDFDDSDAQAVLARK